MHGLAESSIVMRIAVASGKGGSGKTTVATSLALYWSSSHSVHFLDCDVEAPDAALYLNPELGPFQTVTRTVPVINHAVCNLCGQCSAACQHHALALAGSRVLVFPEICHGCGGCVLECPLGAIAEQPCGIGSLQEGQAGAIRFSHGMLNPVGTATVHLIRQVKRTEKEADIAIVDCPPGVSCPAVAAMEGADFVLLVAEPTRFGLHDLALAEELTRRMGLRRGVVINRYGLSDTRVEEFCDAAGLPVWGRIADDRRVAEAYARGEPPLYAAGAFRNAIEALAGRLSAEVLA